MSQFEKILHRGPAIDVAESERVRSLAMARLSTMSAQPQLGATATLTSAPPIVVEGIDAADEPLVATTDVDPPGPAEPEVAEPAAASSDADTIWPATPDASDVVAVLPSREPEAADPPVVATAYCPSCAYLLDPAPVADRSCPRCDRPIIVRVIGDGRLVYLTEAAIEVFEAERIREENERRWAEEQSAWLELAASVGVPMGRIDRLGRTGPSEAAVAAARDLYLTSSEQAADELQGRGAWDMAAGLRRGQANDLHRIAGQPMPPDPAAVELYRRAALTELRGIGAITRAAALVSARCCDECRADEGTVVRISSEVRRTRLPHPGCPEVLCGCHWDLSPADVQAVVRYLQRTGRPITDAG